jgi:hypothetical protein
MSRPYVDDSSRIVGPYHHSNNLKSIPTVSEAYRHMKISSNASLPGKPKRYTSNIRRGKERKARSGSHGSTEELTESLLRNYDEEEALGGAGEEQEVILNDHHGFKVTEYPDIVKKKDKGKKGDHSNTTGEESLPLPATSQKKKKVVESSPTELLPPASEEHHHARYERPSQGHMVKDREELEEEEEIHFPPISSFEVEDPEEHSKNTSSREQKKKSYLSGKPLIGLYEKSKGFGQGGEGKKEAKTDTLATRWLQAQQPKHNDLFDQQDAIEHLNVDRQDQKQSQRSAQIGERDQGEPLTLLDKHFSHSTAVRHFNESMPVSSLAFATPPFVSLAQVLVLPSGFSPETGKLVPSNPKDRIRTTKTKPPQPSLHDSITTEEYDPSSG